MTSIADILKFREPTQGFLCPLSANTYGIDFLAFKIRDMDSGRPIFEVSKDPNAGTIEYPPNFDYDQLRSISYKFPAEFLRFKTVGTTLKFSVGNREVRNFRMIERHYFKKKLVTSYDFNFQFCIPNSVNEWEAIYDLPKLAELEIADMIASPDQTKSDSFYFVDGQLIMHNKAQYSYVEESKSVHGKSSTSTDSALHLSSKSKGDSSSIPSGPPSSTPSPPPTISSSSTNSTKSSNSKKSNVK